MAITGTGLNQEEQVSEAQAIPTTKPTQSAPLRMLATIVSYITHPVFFPLVMAVILSRLAPASFAVADAKQRGMWFINIGLTGVFFPLFSIALMKPLGFISSYHMPTARERTIPLMTSMIFYFWITHVFNSMPAPTPPLALKVLLLGNFWGIIIVFIINIFTKISLHTTASGGMLGSLLVLTMTGQSGMALPLVIGTVVAAIVGFSRAALGAHQRGDIWLGYIIGILVQLAAYIYMK